MRGTESFSGQHGGLERDFYIYIHSLFFFFPSLFFLTTYNLAKRLVRAGVTHYRTSSHHLIKMHDTNRTLSEWEVYSGNSYEDSIAANLWAKVASYMSHGCKYNCFLIFTPLTTSRQTWELFNTGTFAAKQAYSIGRKKKNPENIFPLTNIYFYVKM